MKTALGAASSSAAAIPDDPDVAVALMAHLSGAAPCPILRAIATESRIALRAAVDRKPGAPLQVITDALPLRELLTSSAFVNVLRERGWDDDAIAEEIVMLTFAGWASISAVLESACTVGVGGRSVTAFDVDELLRLAPPGWLITRELTAPTVLAGCTLPSGILVMTSPWLIQRDAAWWPEPGRYDPHRPGLRKSAAYLPFGLGKWACPAELYSRSILLELLRRRDAGAAAVTIRPALIDERSACLMRMGTDTR
ncbi:cytochrome P450 [Dietzia sp. 2505]|uniref:cytochrome P450 n=1 Tax=Dietzia sp. 2505 TaxID=3156457 RepID=UPI003398071E